MSGLTAYAARGKEARAAALLAAVERMERHAFGKRAVHLHLSKLLQFGISAQHARIAAAVFETGVQGLEGEIFPLDDGDLVFIGLARESETIQKAIDKLRFLLEEHGLPDELANGEGLATWFGLDIDFEEFQRHVRSLAVEESQRRKRGEQQPESARPRRMLDPRELAEIERALVSADLAPLVRRQAICAIGREFKPKRVITEFFTSIRAVEQAVAPGIDLTRNRMLFQYLTTVLDGRMLALLRRDRLLGEGQAVSINVNLDTILSQTFLDFDTALPVGSRGRIVLELQQSDVLGNLRDYAFARDFAREQGYRLCIDGATPEALVMLDRRVLRYDLVKLPYTPDLQRQLQGERAAQVREGIEKVGGERIVLHHCEDEAAIRTGHALGIGLFQGHFIDHLLPLSERPGRR